MADFAGRALVAVDAGFRQRVGIAMLRVAIRAAEEAQPRPVWTRKRVVLAQSVLGDPPGALARFAWAVASQDLSTSSTDAEIEQAVAQVWDAVAGVSVDDRR